MRTVGPKEAREVLGDGNFGGLYQRSDEDTARIWAVALEETRGVIQTW